jgi:hypothetical protein
VAADDRFLDDYVRELAEVGERSFRRRYGAPVLIVSGRAARKRAAGAAGTTAKTAADRPTLHGLIGRVFPLVKSARAQGGPVVVGRADDSDVDVVIPDASISKRHCAFEAHDGAAVVTDCGSRNGTAVNGAKLAGAAAVRLAGGEALTLGRLQLTYETASGFAELVGGLDGGRRPT